MADPSSVRHLRSERRRGTLTLFANTILKGARPATTVNFGAEAAIPDWENEGGAI